MWHGGTQLNGGLGVLSWPLWSWRTFPNEIIQWFNASAQVFPKCLSMLHFYLPLALPEAHIICGNVHGAHLREVKILPGSLLLHGNSHWAAHRSCLLASSLLGCREGRRGAGVYPVDLPGQPSYTEHVERSRNHSGGRDAQPMEKQAAAKYRVIWKCSREPGKKKISNNKKKNSVVKPGRRKDTTKLRCTF